MVTAPKIEQLREMSDSDLIAAHDARTEHVVLGVDYYLDELARRGQTRQNDLMVRYTRNILWLTIAVTVATVVNLVLAALVLFRPQTP